MNAYTWNSSTTNYSRQKSEKLTENFLTMEKHAKFATRFFEISSPVVHESTLRKQFRKIFVFQFQTFTLQIKPKKEKCCEFFSDMSVAEILMSDRFKQICSKLKLLTMSYFSVQLCLSEQCEILNCNAISMKPSNLQVPKSLKPKTRRSFMNRIQLETKYMESDSEWERYKQQLRVQRIKILREFQIHPVPFHLLNIVYRLNPELKRLFSLPLVFPSFKIEFTTWTQHQLTDRTVAATGSSIQARALKWREKLK